MFRNLLLLSTLALFMSGTSLVPHASAATLSFTAGHSAAIGQTIQVPLIVSTEGAEVLNAVSAELRFPSNLLTLQSISRDDSIISFWAENPSYSNTNGTASLQGIVPNPGWSGAAGTVVTLVFKVKAAGTAVVSFSSASVLANDGLGTNILSKTYPGTSLLGDSLPQTLLQATTVVPVSAVGAPLAPVLTSTTHTDPSVWYNDANPLFSWKVPDDVTAVRIMYDKYPVSVPSVLYGTITRKQLSKLRDGTYYFHAQFKNASGWGAIAHMRFQIDTTAPKPFEVVNEGQTTEGQSQARISFQATDATSGIDHYTVAVADMPPVTVTKSEAARPYALPVRKSGEETVVVNAYDKAGNVTSASITLNIVAIEPPRIIVYSKQLKSGDSLTVSGETYPGANAVVTIKDPGGDTYTESTIADSAGKFSLIGKRQLALLGDYHFTAAAQNNTGVVSPSTDELTFMVADSPLSLWGSTALEYLLFVFVVVAGTALVVGVGYVSWYRLGNLRRRLKHLAVRSGRGVQYDFERIMDDLHSLATLLHKAKQTRALTKEEDVILETLKQHLKKMEDDILSKLEQIDDEAGV